MTADSRARVADALRSILDMAGRLEQRAIDRANDREMPGGEALVNLAGVGSMSAWNARQEAREELGDYDTSAEDPDDLWPAVQVLAFWSEDFRRQLGMDHDGWRPTLVSEAKFLRNTDVAEWIWNNEIHWDDFAADVAKARAKLENVLIEGERAERTAVVCNNCDAGRQLIHVWGATPADDRWKCPGCKHLLTDEELDTALAAQMRRTEPKPWVPRPQAMGLLRSLGHQERAALRLIDNPETQGWCDRVTHVRWVAWPDVWRRHLLEMQTKKLKAKRLEKSA